MDLLGCELSEDKLDVALDLDLACVYRTPNKKHNAL
jgi:hypothetical protein